MKKVFLGTVLALLSTSVFADLTEYHKEVICNSEEVLSQMGAGGSCNIVIKEKKTEDRKGACFGKFDRNLNCLIVFATVGKSSAVQLKCGVDKIDFAIFDQTLTSKSAYYNISALIKDSNGRKTIMNDLTNHVYYSNDLLLLYLAENEKKEVIGEAIMNLETNGVALKDLECRYF